MKDSSGRNINYMRISVTPDCNFKCFYCVNAGQVYKGYMSEQQLSIGEIVKICALGAKLGIQYIKLTGGEPLMRSDLPELIENIDNIDGIKEISMTTNASILSEKAQLLKQSGLHAVNISLDTLRADKFAAFTGGGNLRKVLEGIDAAVNVGLAVKINCTVVKNKNEDELADFVDFSLQKKVPVRFIELMPIGEGRFFDGIDKDTMLKILKKTYPLLTPASIRLGRGPAQYYSLPDQKGYIGFIGAVHNKFCNECNRIRVTSDGMLKSCLAQEKEINLLTQLRNHAADGVLLQLLEEVIWNKPLCHNFEDGIKASGARTMNQIGG